VQLHWLEEGALPTQLHTMSPYVHEPRTNPTHGDPLARGAVGHEHLRSREPPQTQIWSELGYRHE